MTATADPITAPATTTPPAATSAKPTVRVSVLTPHKIDNADISVLVSACAPAGIAEKAAQTGLPAIRQRVEEACRGLAEVTRFSTLNSQILAAQARVENAERARERTRAAKRLLEDRPEEGLAEKLRQVTAQLAEAEVEEAAAVRDLAEIRHLVPRHFVAAANATHSKASSDAICHAITLYPARDEAEAELKAACRDAEKFIAEVIETVVAPAIGKFLVARRAADAMGEWKPFGAVTRALVGPPPPGVVPAGDKFALAPAPTSEPAAA